MKKMTQKEFDALPRDKYGVKHCPGNTGYSSIKEFGHSCSFGEGCRFDQSCRFEGGHKAKLGNPLLQFDRIGSRLGCTRFFNTEDGIIVRCGCFKGNLDHFRDRVCEEYGEVGHGLIYLWLANVAEEYFRQEDERNK